jgi:hypothetical protein
MFADFREIVLADFALAMSQGRLHTVFGWNIRIGENSNPRALRNFPMQANGTEMMRLACCLATERGIEVCAPVHDALLICAPLERCEADVAATRAAMAEASRVVLSGFEIGTDAKLVACPDRLWTDAARSCGTACAAWPPPKSRRKGRWRYAREGRRVR